MFLIVFLVLLVMSGFLLSIPGKYWPWFVITGGCAVASAVLGPRWYRMAGIAGSALCLGLIVWDVKSGVEYRKRFESLRRQTRGTVATNGESVGSANRSQSVLSETNQASTSAGYGR
jgi:membrane protein implicated in regulation of membrane protease activity